MGKIILAIIKTIDNNIYVGKNHSDIIRNNLHINFKNGYQGFIDDRYEYYSREEDLIEESIK